MLMGLSELKQRSRIILALDRLGKLGEPEILKGVLSRVAGVKIGLPLVLSREFTSIMETLKNFDIYVLADFKLADIPYIMIKTIEKIADFIDGVIAHAFIGRDAISSLSEFLSKQEIELFLVVAMTHKGAEEFINRFTHEFIEIARDLANGAVAPATFPEKIVLARKLLGDKIILSPGIGAQGAGVGSAIKHGADFEIIGRLITMSSNPLAVVDKINSIHFALVGP